MESLKTIVLATDFSDQSAKAEALAVDLAVSCQATLHVVHGIEPIMGVEDEDSAEFEEFYHRLIERAEAEMEDRSAGWASRQLIVKQHVQIGPRWKVVLEVADQEEADLVVLGRRTYTSGKRVPLGTTSQKVFYGCSRPVMLIPHE